jgi:hypothetical protein
MMANSVGDVVNQRARLMLLQAQERTLVLKTRVAELEAYSARLEARVESLDKQVRAVASLSALECTIM